MEQAPIQEMSREEELKMLLEIYENTRKTKNYMKWQLVITVGLVVLPILGFAIATPLLFKSLGSTYGIGGGTAPENCTPTSSSLYCLTH
jgi:hypothetical protein